MSCVSAADIYPRCALRSRSTRFGETETNDGLDEGRSVIRNEGMNVSPWLNGSTMDVLVARVSSQNHVERMIHKFEKEEQT